TPYGVDTGPHHWSVRHRPHGWAVAARAVTAAGTGPYPYLAAAVGGWLGGGRDARRGVPAALLALLALLAGQVLRTALMLLLHRSRPPVVDWAAHASGHAFPSGHSASSAMAAGVLAWGLLRTFPGAVGRVAAWACGAVALLIGLTRVYLGVHWPTDVLGAWLFAGCWMAVVLPALSAYADGGDGSSGDRMDGPGGAAGPGRDGRPGTQTDTP
ncbi:phosphatase PAP2 family protein, partial [Actinacidiphila rubida]